MELFTIQCTTCRARLKVNDESAIGEILACPKCRSMVQVVPPVGWQGATGAAAGPRELVLDEPAVKTGSSISPAASSAAIKPSAATPPALPTRPAVRPGDSTVNVAASASAPIAPPLPERSPADVPTSQPAESQVAAGVESAAATDHSTIWAALAARARQDWLMLGAGLFGGVVLGAMVWLIVASQSADDEVVAQASPSSQVAATPKPAPLTNAPAARQKTPAAKPATDEPIETLEETVPVDDAPAAPAREESPGEPAAVEPVAGGATSATPVPAAAVKPATDEPSEPTLKLDPVIESATALQSPAADQRVAGVLPPSAAAADAEPLEEAPKVRPTTKPPRGASTPSRRTLSQSEVDERLGASLPQVEFVKTPLAQFVEFVADFSSLPIVIDDAALKTLGLTRQTPVTVQLSDTTAGDALSAAIDRLGLVGELVGDRFIIRAAKKATK